MISNPMQRKSRNAFLLGMLITLVVAGAIVIVLLMMLKQKNEELQAQLASKVTVYTLTQDVKAGQILTQDMFQTKQVDQSGVPSNATSSAVEIESWFLQTKEGESVFRDKYGLYLSNSEQTPADTILEVRQNLSNTFKDSKGNEVAVNDYYLDVDGTTEKINSLNSVQSDEYGYFYIDTKKIDTKTRVYQEASTGEFFVYKIDIATLNASGIKARVKEYIDIKNVPVLAKVDMAVNTVITSEFVVQSDAIITDDVRQQEYNMISLPVDLMTNDYVDIRLMTPSGQNFIVVSKTQVEIPMNSDGTYIADTIKVNLREDEILAMSSAIVEAYGLLGSKLYVTKYVDPAMQEAALPTYTPNAAVTTQISTNPNIVEIAKAELAARYSEAAKTARNNYLQQIINATEDYNDNIQEGMEADIGSSASSRKQYLDSLNY